MTKLHVALWIAAGVGCVVAGFLIESAPAFRVTP